MVTLTERRVHEPFHPFHRAVGELRQRSIFRSMILQPFAVTDSFVPLMQALFLKKCLSIFQGVLDLLKSIREWGAFPSQSLALEGKMRTQGWRILRGQENLYWGQYKEDLRNRSAGSYSHVGCF